MAKYYGGIEKAHTAIPGLRGNVWRNAEAGPALCAHDGIQTLYENWERAVSLYADHACVGWRPINPSSGEAGDFVWLTYKTVFERAGHFGSGIRKLGLASPTEDFPNGLLGFYAKNRVEWTLGTTGCYRQNIGVVPMYAMCLLCVCRVLAICMACLRGRFSVNSFCCLF